MKVIQSPNGAKGVDTIARFSTDLARKFHAAGYQFIVRYLTSSKWGLTVEERQAILDAEMGLLCVGTSRLPGWHPSAELGESDARKILGYAQNCGLLTGMTLFCDMEGPGGDAGKSVVEYVNAWAHIIKDAGYIAGLYVGFGIHLTPEQLYHDLAVSAYWHSCSKVQDVATRGYQMVQHYPANQHVCGLQVDIDTIQVDKLGDSPWWLVND